MCVFVCVGICRYTFRPQCSYHMTISHALCSVRSINMNGKFTSEKYCFCHVSNVVFPLPFCAYASSSGESICKIRTLQSILREACHLHQFSTVELQNKILPLAVRLRYMHWNSKKNSIGHTKQKKILLNFSMRFLLNNFQAKSMRDEKYRMYLST